MRWSKTRGVRHAPGLVGDRSHCILWVGDEQVAEDAQSKYDVAPTAKLSIGCERSFAPGRERRAGGSWLQQGECAAPASAHQAFPDKLNISDQKRGGHILGNDLYLFAPLFDDVVRDFHRGIGYLDDGVFAGQRQLVDLL